MIECKPRNEVYREGKRVLEKRGRKWEDNIIKLLKGMCCEDVYKISLAPNRDQWFALVNRQFLFSVQCGDFFF